MPTPGITELGDRCDDRASEPIKHPSGKQHTHGYQTKRRDSLQYRFKHTGRCFLVFRTSGDVDEDLLVGR
jgi:hypothetical protein